MADLMLTHYYAFLPDGRTLLNQTQEGVKSIFPIGTIMVRMGEIHMHKPYHKKISAIEWKYSYSYDMPILPDQLMPEHKAFLFLLGLDPNHDKYRDSIMTIAKGIQCQHTQ